MSELAGKINEVWILTGTNAMTGSTGAKIASADNSIYNKMAEILEITAFGDVYKKRMPGLKDSSVSISGNYHPADTNGQLILEPGDSVYIGIYPLGSAVAGKQIPMIVESFEQKADMSKQTFSCSLQGNGAPVTLPARS